MCEMNKKETIKHFYEVIVSNNLLNELPQYVSENCVLIDGERKIPLGLEGMKEHLTAVKQTYPDYTMRILRQYKDGDYIISEFVMEGTHEGEWIGIKPTHKMICTPKVRHIWRCIFLWAKQEEKTKRTRQNSKSML